MLIAQRDILYGFKTYLAGEKLPDDKKMSPLWLESGAAVEIEENSNTTKVTKAIPAAAPAGLTGTVDGAATQDGSLVGVVPQKKGRKKTT